MHAGTSEVFGTQGRSRCTERTQHQPRSPYAAAKSAAMTAVQVYREAYNLFACNAILFNHESPLRPESFVISKIVNTAARIAACSNDDYVIATGATHTLADVIDRVGDYFKLPLAKVIISSSALLRPCDHSESYADPSKAQERMGWHHTVDFDDLVRQLCTAAAGAVSGRASR
jgi:GDPmannose 4,6-dehydratase